jgi:hypothetical protein
VRVLPVTESRAAPAAGRPRASGGLRPSPAARQAGTGRPRASAGSPSRSRARSVGVTSSPREPGSPRANHVASSVGPAPGLSSSTPPSSAGREGRFSAFRRIPQARHGQGEQVRHRSCRMRRGPPPYERALQSQGLPNSHAHGIKYRLPATPIESTWCACQVMFLWLIFSTPRLRR